ncbi:MAG: sulfatase-like hydrolase/transferase, partial [Burkholderiales bacterium]|nr:sulfatase-like hydrolase/transferase [Burkholderiales bacterium]
HKFPIGDGESAVNVASNGPYKDGRGSLHEGALRALAVVWRPGQVRPGTISELMHAVDLYPTLLQLAGAGAGEAQHKPIDGIDQWATLTEGSPGGRKEVTEATRATRASAPLTEGSPGGRKEVLLNVEEFRGALRVDDWKLILHASLPGKVELYNLRDDPSEENNQAEREGERVHAMSKRLTEYAWEMAPALYLEDLTRPRKVETPMYWGENPVRE